MKSLIIWGFLWGLLVIPTQAQEQHDHTLRRIHVPILMYHYVGTLPPEPDRFRVDLTVHPERFRQHMQYLHEQGYQTITFDQLDRALNWGDPLPPKPIILTFDDGYVDHYMNVLPILQAFNFTGTFFIITQFVDEQHPNYLTWAQVQTMATAGMSMQAHTKTHPDLRNRDRDFLIYQILGSIESLAHHVGQRPVVFSYPAGRYDALTLTIVEELQIIRAVTTQHGAYHTTDNRHEMPRLRISHDTTVAGLSYLIAGN